MSQLQTPLGHHPNTMHALHANTWQQIFQQPNQILNWIYLAKIIGEI